MPKKTEEQLRTLAIEEMSQYIKKKGDGDLIKNAIIWHKYPVCIKDLCVTAVMLSDGKITFGDYNEKTQEYKMRKSCDNIDSKFFKACLEDMQAIDNKKNK